MKPYLSAPDGQTIYCGNVMDVLRQVPDESVQCVVTSPPYWGLRDYATATWEGGDPMCKHRVGGQVEDNKAKGAITTGQRPGVDASTCKACGARRIDRQIGLEPTTEAYVATMVEVFREVRRVLRRDGCLFLNIGDSYYGSGRGPTGENGIGDQAMRQGFSSSASVRRGAPCDTSGRVPEGSPERDCLCGSLCDACRRAYQIGKSHSAIERAPKHLPSLVASSLGRMASGDGHLPSSDSKRREVRNSDATSDPAPSALREGERPLSSQQTTTDESSQLCQGGCHQSDTPSACPLCGHSSTPCVLASADRKACPCASQTDPLATSGHHASIGDSVVIGDSSDGHKSGMASDLAYRDYTTASHRLKPKDLCMIPARVALALQQDGWYLRSAITWCKTSAMPESVRDRPTSATEMIFLLTKGATYFYDSDAVREESAESTQDRAYLGKRPIGPGQQALVDNGFHGKTDSLRDYGRTGANQRNFWLLGPEPYRDAHFATFPSTIPRRAILAGTSEAGCCPKCGKAWVRVTERIGGPPNHRFRDGLAGGGKSAHNEGTVAGVALSRLYRDYGYPDVKQLGFRAACRCEVYRMRNDLTSEEQAYVLAEMERARAVV